MTADFRRFDPYAPRPPAGAAEAPVHPSSIMATRQGAAMLASVLIHKLGGKVVLTQSDFDEVAYTRLMESNERDETGKEMHGQALALWLESHAPRSLQ